MTDARPCRWSWLFGALALAGSQTLAKAQETAGSLSTTFGPSIEEQGGEPRTPILPDGTPADAIALNLSEPIESLTQAIDAAYWSNPVILAERARKRSADFLLPQARAQFGPTIEYELSHGYRRDRVDLPTDDLNISSGWSSSASLVLSQPLATFGRLRANEQQAVAAIEFQEHTLERAEQELLYSVIVAYTLLIRDRNGLQIARDNLELLSRELSDTRARFEVRETTRADLQQVETRVRLAEAQVAVATSSLAESEARFHEVVGAPAGDIQPPNPLQLPVDGLPEARAHALENNPVVKAAHARERISRAETSSAVSARLPRVDLRGRVDLLPVTPYSNDLRQRGLVGEVVISGPLFTGGELAARVSEARANNDADWRLIDAASRGLVAEVSSAWRNLEAQMNAVESLSFAVEAAEAAYQGSLTQQRAGTRTTLDVLILARELLTARTSLNVASTDAYLARARILLALGDIDRSYLLPNADIYNPAAHQEDVAWSPPIVIFGPIFRTLSVIGRPKFEDRPSRDGYD